MSKLPSMDLCLEGKRKNLRYKSVTEQKDLTSSGAMRKPRLEGPVLPAVTVEQPGLEASAKEQAADPVNRLALALPLTGCVVLRKLKSLGVSVPTNIKWK